ncbi:MAG TPA: sigma 54-interacting transcriptional regulator [Planctomycetota bacterium]|nr:sigma 54-interacting transcriptional regulator [Planctomycetota bacterium]
MLRIEIRHKTQGVSYFESPKSSIFLGRDRSMDLVLDDPLVSRQHAVIISRGSDFVLQDIGGRNPIRVNRKEVLSHVLSPGDLIEVGETSLVFNEATGSAERPLTDLSPTVVDARKSIEHFQDSGEWVPASVEDTVSSSAALLARSREGRSKKNLRILQNFSELVRNISDHQKLLTAALDTAFDNLEVRRGFIGFFTPQNQMEIRVEQSQGSGRVASYSRSIVERVRREAVAILFSDNGPFSDSADDAGGSTPMLDSKSVVRLNIKSAMCLPIFVADQVVGVLYVDNRERSESFTPEDLYFANILSHLISLALEKEDLYQRIQDENIELKTILHQKNRLIGVSSAIKEILRKIKKVAGFDTTVLIVGESGTGKELVARAIHDRSARRGNPFVAVNCAAIPETLLESELFGYAPKSGISGSDPRGKPGKFEQAHGGTLFLDEIGDMSLSTQAKILRVLEDKVVDRLGGMEGIRVDLRIVAATNKILEKAVADGTFREDLYYRLKVFKVETPSLRERREDILPLCHHFLALYATEARGPLELSPRARELLSAYHWPGNIRELKNSIEESILLSNGRIIYPENLPSDLRRGDNPQPFATLEQVEAQHIGRVLQSVTWNKRRAAEILGINRSTLYEKIRLYGIERPKDASPGAPGGTSESGAAPEEDEESEPEAKVRPRRGGVGGRRLDETRPMV